jgi:hypothetical protein
MTKKKTPDRSDYCQFREFIFGFPSEHQPPLATLIQRSKRGRFPKFFKPGSQKAGALFLKADILEYAKTEFEAIWPGTTAKLEKLLGTTMETK